jgi:hypothetical protein
MLCNAMSKHPALKKIITNPTIQQVCVLSISTAVKSINFYNNATVFAVGGFLAPRRRSTLS